MMITFVIFILSMTLFLGYLIGMKRSLGNRLAANTVTENDTLDEELIMDMAEYKVNVKKLGALSAAIGACCVISFFIL